ncbi:hypothetical protein Ancab_024189, partial [Ancistrocladus abbreviatus]
MDPYCPGAKRDRLCFMLGQIRAKILANRQCIERPSDSNFRSEQFQACKLFWYDENSAFSRIGQGRGKRRGDDGAASSRVAWRGRYEIEEVK